MKNFLNWCPEKLSFASYFFSILESLCPWQVCSGQEIHLSYMHRWYKKTGKNLVLNLNILHCNVKLCLGRSYEWLSEEAKEKSEHLKKSSFCRILILHILLLSKKTVISFPQSFSILSFLWYRETNRTNVILYRAAYLLN